MFNNHENTEALIVFSNLLHIIDILILFPYKKVGGTEV